MGTHEHKREDKKYIKLSAEERRQAKVDFDAKLLEFLNAEPVRSADDQSGLGIEWRCMCGKLFYVPIDSGWAYTELIEGLGIRRMCSYSCHKKYKQIYKDLVALRFMAFPYTVRLRDIIKKSKEEKHK